MPGVEEMADMMLARAAGGKTEAEALEVAYHARRMTVEILSPGTPDNGGGEG